MSSQYGMGTAQNRRQKCVSFICFTTKGAQTCWDYRTKATLSSGPYFSKHPSGRTNSVKLPELRPSSLRANHTAGCGWLWKQKPFPPAKKKNTQPQVSCKPEHLVVFRIGKVEKASNSSHKTPQVNPPICRNSFFLPASSKGILASKPGRNKEQICCIQAWTKSIHPKGFLTKKPQPPGCLMISNTITFVLVSGAQHSQPPASHYSSAPNFHLQVSGCTSSRKHTKAHFPGKKR